MICQLSVKLTMGLLWIPLVVQSASHLPPGIAKALQAQGIPEADVSLYVSRVSGISPSLTLNPSVPRNPASVMKLLTSLVALDILGPDFQWRTEAYIDGSLRDGKLTGDLILKGYGDPYLTPERFWQLLHGLQDRGLRQIAGDLIIDNSYFAAPTAHRGDFDGKPRRAYNALPRPLSLNFQATQLHIRADQNGDTISAFTNPRLANLEIRNQMKLVSGACQKQYLRPKIRFTEHERGATVNIQGTYSKSCPEWTNPYLVMEPDAHIAGAFRALWIEMGGQLSGEIKQDMIPRDAKLFHQIESRPLAEVIRGMNKFSNNLMSRMLLLTMSAETRGIPASIAQGQTLITDWLDRSQLPSGMVRVSNGAGLARDAQISAEIVGRLLQTAFDSPMMPEFMASLPIVGIDGTMRHRLRKTGVAGRAHIKTGSLNDVSSMAGYVQDRYNQRWVVTLIINHPGLQTWQGKQVQDALLRWIYQGPKRVSTQTGLITDTSAPECNGQQQTKTRTEEFGDKYTSVPQQAKQALLQTAAIGEQESLD
ncbi:MAG: D-alanyl-D-alanine carboxypeptidase/D-alanyl-D-alanine-endopeptidase [Gammaproteobacteria bacterium]|nr:D-alanyl-D-alanine carboxypeptidase/D-alanyl-D-alanine-endopeptidase [Gammaproteobacteria bacterium]